MFVHSFFHLFTHLLIPFVGQSINQSINQSLNQLICQSGNQSTSQSVSQSVSQSFVSSFVHSFVRSFIHSFFHSFTHSFIHSFIYSFSYSCLYSYFSRIFFTRNSSTWISNVYPVSRHSPYYWATLLPRLKIKFSSDFVVFLVTASFKRRISGLSLYVYSTTFSYWHFKSTMAKINREIYSILSCFEIERSHFSKREKISQCSMGFPQHVAWLSCNVE